MNEWMTEFDEFKFIDRQFYPGVDEDFIPNGSVRTYGIWNGKLNKSEQKLLSTIPVTEYDSEG